MTHSAEYRRILNRMGYYNYNNALIHRHLDQDGGWDSHLECSRRFILKALDYHKPEKVTVLGSGWLLDLPISELVENNLKINLVDIIHSPEVIKQAGSLNGVSLIEDDITGGLIKKVWEETKKYSFFKPLKSLENVFLQEYSPDYDPGMVISLNLLTQLEYLPVAFLKKRSGIREEDFSRFRAEIQKKHIDFLKKHNSVLISDITEIIITKSGAVTKIPTLRTDLPSALFTDEWLWNFEKESSDKYNSRSLLNVVALTF
jgi:hypothetical protein